ncbi:zinc-dependent peptidase [Cytophagaceae bacterium ABcell3]|nr:zinc-dependent peptidase [Cytophagaceae bacterium ABcell3]
MNGELDFITNGFIAFFLVVVFLATGVYIRKFFFAGKHKSFTPYNNSLPENLKAPLKQYFLYYNFLSPTQKAEFEHRVNNFIHNKNFIPMHGMVITDEVKALIAASAIQLTFGLPEVYFVHFETVMVFPDKFFNKQTQSLHKGEVGTGGHIAFSWHDFADGYIKHDDTYNVGLHEMAHALKLENSIKNKEYRFLDEKKLLNWKTLADDEFNNIKTGQASFLRKYATSNRDEFFPVCVEHFFERPCEFKQESPHLYRALAELLQQDILEGKNTVGPV